jgi:hypothetical protein
MIVRASYGKAREGYYKEKGNIIPTTFGNFGNMMHDKKVRGSLPRQLYTNYLWWEAIIAPGRDNSVFCHTTLNCWYYPTYLLIIYLSCQPSLH